MRYLETGFAANIEVEHDELGRMILRQLQRPFAVGRTIGVEAALAKRA